MTQSSDETETGPGADQDGDSFVQTTAGLEATNELAAGPDAGPGLALVAALTALAGAALLARRRL